MALTTRSIAEPSAPAYDAASVTPSDTADLSPSARALYVGGAGDVALDTMAGTTVTLAGVPAGAFLPISCKRVRATGTTATDIVALY